MILNDEQKQLISNIAEKAQNLQCDYQLYKNFTKKKYTIAIKRFIEKNEQFTGPINQFLAELRKLDNRGNFNDITLLSYISTYNAHLWKYEGIAIIKKRTKKSFKVLLISTPQDRENISPPPEITVKEHVNPVVSPIVPPVVHVTEVKKTDENKPKLSIIDKIKETLVGKIK